MASVVALSVGASLVAGTSRADDPRQACLDAAEQGQALEKDGKLISAREAFGRCAAQECPGLVRRDCTQWLAEVDDKLPTVMLGARDAHGSDQLNVQISADGKPVAGALDGKPIAFDPGPHRFRFEQPGSAPVEQEVILREREKGRALLVTLGAPDAAPAKTAAPEVPPAHRTVPVAAYVLAGTAAVSLGLFTYFGLRGVSDRSHYDCGQGCSGSEADTVRSELRIADVALAAGVLCLGGAAVLLITGKSDRTAAGSALRFVGAGPGGLGVRF
jgi:hypothetical protein